MSVSEEKDREFRELYPEFVATYATASAGKKHASLYESCREQGRKNYREVIEAWKSGANPEQLVDEVLRKLLPHTDNKGNRESGAWIHVAPFITKSLKLMYEGSKLVAPDDWPKVTTLILTFLQRCVEHPESLEEACKHFAESPYSKGFQAGSLSPILNALAPEQFLLVNNKAYRVIGHFSGKKHARGLDSYPKLIQTEFELIHHFGDILPIAELPTLSPYDGFDMFIHWYDAVKVKPGYWKIAPGEGARLWEEWLSGGYMAIGWGELGDISTLDKDAFSQLMESTRQVHPDWSKSGMRQVWNFANKIRPGDRVLANHGVASVVGTGTVTGEYEFVPGVEYPHRIPVDWERSEREIPKQPWNRTLLPLTKEVFDMLLSGTAPNRLNSRFFRFFASPEASEQFFLMARMALDTVGATGPEDPRIAFNIRSNPHLIRLNYGRWAIMAAAPATKAGPQLQLTVLREKVDLSKYAVKSTFYDQGDGDILAIVTVPQCDWEELDPELKEGFLSVLELAKVEFASMKGSPYKDTMGALSVEAIYQKAVRDALLCGDIEPPSLAKLMRELHLPESMLKDWLRAIERKGQIILYGPPGTGKTYVAEHLAQYLVAGGDGFHELVQFHPSYAYEDFIQGIRPQVDKGVLRYELVSGRFIEFCDRALRCRGTCVLILDEINRANLSRVFGELMYLLEYRDQEIPLAGGRRLSIPANVRIIGTMNTADRSIALVDHALRRRFAFLRLAPNHAVLRSFHAVNGFDTEPLIQILEKLNQQINDPHYEIGISYFLKEELKTHIGEIWQSEIEPYLEELFFDQPHQVEAFRWSKMSHEVLPQ